MGTVTIMTAALVKHVREQTAAAYAARGFNVPASQLKGL